MARPFADVLRELAGGEVYEELSAQTAEVVAAVQETRKVGEVSFKLKFKPNGENSVIVTEEIKSKVPELPRGETVFFTTADGGLMRNDPRQERLPLRDVKPRGDEEVREVSA